MHTIIIPLNQFILNSNIKLRAPRTLGGNFPFYVLQKYLGARDCS